MLTIKNIQHIYFVYAYQLSLEQDQSYVIIHDNIKKCMHLHCMLCSTLLIKVNSCFKEEVRDVNSYCTWQAKRHVVHGRNPSNRVTQDFRKPLTAAPYIYYYGCESFKFNDVNFNEILL